MMVERIAAGPIDQPDIGIGATPAVVVVGLARVQQHVGDPRDRDEFVDAVATHRHLRQRHRDRRLAGVRDRAQRKGKAAARQPDLAEHRGQHNRHPDRLLAMLGALQRHRAGDQRAAAGDAARQRDDLGLRHAADRCGPRGVLLPAIVPPEQICLENLPAGAIAVEKFAVVQVLGEQRVREAEHQRDIGAGPDRMPERGEIFGQIVAQRPDQMKFDAAPVAPRPAARGRCAGSCRRRRHRCSSTPCRQTRGPARFR